MQSSFGRVRRALDLAPGFIQKQLLIFFFLGTAYLSDRFNFVFHLADSFNPSCPCTHLPLSPLILVIHSPAALPCDSPQGMRVQPGVITETYTLGLDPC